MSVHFISGKPGGGKTLYAMRLIVEELVRGTRMIVTNVPINLGRLNEYLQEKYPAFYERHFCVGDANIIMADHEDKFRTGANFGHISDRILLIDEEELGHFFTFRGNGVRLESITNAEWKAGKRPDFSKVRDGGVFYVLDEVHIAFNARAWAETGAEVLYYLSQHRKLGDDVICITQNVGNVDKQFRSVAQDFTYIRNLSKKRAGLFRLPKMFVRSTYSQPATDRSQADTSGTFTLDVRGLASCYDTAKGVGIHGRAGADKNERKSGLHWLWFVIGAPLIIWGIIHFTPNLLLRFLGGSPAHHPPAAAPAKLLPVAPPSPPVSLVAPVPQLPILQKTESVIEPPAPNEKPVAVTNQLYCKGFWLPNANGRDGLVFLSDGTSVEMESGRVSLVEKSFVVVDGVKLPVLKGSGYYQPKEKAPVFEEAVPVEPEQIQERYVRPPFGGITVTPPIGGSHQP